MLNMQNIIIEFFSSRNPETTLSGKISLYISEMNVSVFPPLITIAKQFIRLN